MGLSASLISKFHEKNHKLLETNALIAGISSVKTLCTEDSQVKWNGQCSQLQNFEGNDVGRGNQATLSRKNFQVPQLVPQLKSFRKSA